MPFQTQLLRPCRGELRVLATPGASETLLRTRRPRRPVTRPTLGQAGRKPCGVPCAGLQQGSDTTLPPRRPRPQTPCTRSVAQTALVPRATAAVATGEAILALNLAYVCPGAPTQVGAGLRPCHRSGTRHCPRQSRPRARGRATRSIRRTAAKSCLAERAAAIRAHARGGTRAPGGRDDDGGMMGSARRGAERAGTSSRRTLRALRAEGAVGRVATSTPTPTPRRAGPAPYQASQAPGAVRAMSREGVAHSSSALADMHTYVHII
eukprot:scaffold1782_cov414-Prasinococcus_capsulatus_cf.AAC.5